jgi:secreted trypsin-like serine protease
MKKIILALLLILIPNNAYAVQNGQLHSGDPKVVYVVVSKTNSWYFCSAVLLKEDIVVTAAHCLSKPNTEDGSLIVPISSISVGMPGTNPYKSSERISAKQVIFSKYANFFNGSTDLRSMVNDIAFVVLSKPAVSGYSVKVATKEDVEKIKSENIPLTTFGYGDQKSRYADGNVYYVELRARYKKYSWEFNNVPTLESHSIILDETEEKALCGGDSGGPSFLKQNDTWVLVSVSSTGSGCGLAAKSGGGSVHTLVYPYLDSLPKPTVEISPAINSTLVETKTIKTQTSVVCVRNKIKITITREKAKCPRGWIQK